ncbi:MAG: hypothetical protein DI585_06255 [Pseudomonas fluorescens]|nr:MAG: hypothetical protein DI585_06255 [Pseudomonas fluorescens]
MMNSKSLPQHVQGLLDELIQLQVQIESLPGPRLHQDHDFIGEKPDLEILFEWLGTTLWVPYWGEPEGHVMLLGGRDPWIETLDMKLWDILAKLAMEAGCSLTGRGSVSPDDSELEEIRHVLPSVAESQGWVFGGDSVFN